MRGLRDAVAVAREEGAHRAAFLERVAFVQVGITEPAPVVRLLPTSGISSSSAGSLRRISRWNSSTLFFVRSRCE